MYPYNYAFSADFEVISILVLTLCGIVIFFMLALSVVSYILASLGVYTIAKNRGIRHPWLAWFPYGNMWILGSISDQYQYVVKGNVKNRRKLLLSITIVLAVLMISIVVLEALSAMGFHFAMVLMVVAYVAVVVLSVTGSVFQYMACYDLFRSCMPKNATVFLVLGIFFQVTLPFFLFACRNQEQGMPPRRRTVAEPVFIEQEPEEYQQED